MAIKVSGNTVIDDSRNLVNVQSITFDDATVQTTAAGGGGGGTVVHEMGDLIHTFDNPNIRGVSAADRFGAAVDITDKYYLIGSYNETSYDSFTDSGVVYVYDRKTNNLVHILENPSWNFSKLDDQFGQYIAAHGKYAVIGAAAEDTPNSGQGAAYIYDLDTGELLHTIPSLAPDSFASFGRAVSIFGNQVAIAAPFGDDPTGTNGTIFEGGAVFIFNVITGELVKTIPNPNAYGTASGDSFGTSVSLYGEYLVVGADAEESADGVNSGKVYVFNVTDGDLLYTIDNPNAVGTSENDFFGGTVSIYDNYIAVGASSEDSYSGRVYIFDLNNNASLLYTIDNPNPYGTDYQDYFGGEVALADGYLIATATGEDDAGGTSSGKAYIFDLNDNASLVHTIDNPNAYGTSQSDSFSYYIRVCGRYLIAGAEVEDDAGGTSSGKAYVFAVSDIINADNVEEIVFDNGYTLSANHKLFQPSLVAGELVHTLAHPNYLTSSGHEFGNAVAMHGNYAIVGAHYGDSEVGTAHVYNVTTGELIHSVTNPNIVASGGIDDFGISVAISDKYFVVGAEGEEDPSTLSSGAGVVYVFDLKTGELVRTIENPNSYGTAQADRFGSVLAISGNNLIVGVYQEDDASGTSSGKAYILDVTTGTLLHTLNNPNPYDTSVNDFFGISVAISGKYAVVGALAEDEASGTDSGKVYVFDVNTGDSVHTINNPNAYSTVVSDNFGNYVTISGNYIIATAPFEDDAGGSSSGKAYIFDATTGSLLHTLDNPNAYGTSSLDNFGVSVSIDGNYAIIGAWPEDDAGGTQSGKAYIFDIVSGKLLHTLDNPNVYSTSLSDQFGYAVYMSGNYAIVGAWGEDGTSGGASGRAYIYSVTNQTVADRLLTLAKS